MIKAVFFDLYGTLAKFHPAREDVQTQACQPFGFQVARDGLVRGYAVADEWMASTNASSTPVHAMSREQRAQFFAEYERLVLQGAGVNVDMETAGRVWDRVRQIPYGLVLFEDVIPALGDLKEHGLTLATLTNVPWPIQQMCDELGLSPYLDFALTSWEVGAGKPHPPIFLEGLKRAGVAPAEALMVGDSYRSDVQGALGVGIRPLLLDRDGVLPPVDECPKISNLTQVTGHL